MEPTFDNLQAILQNQKLDGNMLTCTFKATNQQQGLDAMHMFVPTQEEIMAKVMAHAAKSAAVNTGASMLGNALGSAIGGAAGSMASGAVASGAGMAAQSAMGTFNPLEMEITDDLKKQGVVNAFKTIQTYYEWKDNAWHYKM